MKKAITILILFVIFKVEAQASTLAIADSLYATASYTKAINAYAKEGSQKANLQIARAYNAIGNFDKAVVQYENVVKENPDWQIASFELGKLLIKTKAYDEARKLFTRLSGSAKENPEYHYYLGEAFRELEQSASSLVSYKKAVTLDSRHLKSIFQLGKYFVITKEKVSALEYLDKGLRFYPNDVSLINLKALALYNNDQYFEAQPLFERLLELGEKKDHVYSKLANCYFQTWELEKSIAIYHILIERDQDNNEAYFNLGHVFFKDRQRDSASYYIKKSIEVQKVTFEREYESLARFARTEDDLKTALKYYKLAFKEDATNHRVFYQICAINDQNLKQPEAKLEHYENFIRMFGKDKPYISASVLKRISQLKEEIHFAKD